MNQGNGFLHDTDGGLSSMRLVFLVIAFMIVGVWGYVCVSKEQLVDFPSGVVWVLGSCLFGKVSQKVVELWGQKAISTKEVQNG